MQDTKTVAALTADQMLMALVEANVEKLRATAQHNGARPGDALIVTFTDESHIVLCVSQDDGAKLAKLSGAETVYAYMLACIQAGLTGGAVPCLCSYVDEKRDRFATGCTTISLN